VTQTAARTDTTTTATSEVMAIGVSPEHTSVPRWAVVPPEVDGSGRGFLVVSSGDAGRAVAGDWCRRIEALGRPMWSRHVADGVPADALAERLEQERVGVRVMIAGPELAALDAARAARAAGVVDAEIRIHVTDRGQRRVQCPHCHTHTVATVAVEEIVPCAGCGRSLFVYHHVSRYHGAYLGFMADAEQPGG
jgi:hypothetical protein